MWNINDKIKCIKIPQIKNHGGFEMKIILSATGKGLESQVDVRFGRCPFYVAVEVENNKITKSESIENPAAMQGGGAGISAAQLVANMKPNAVITNNIGPRAFQVLSQVGITVYQGNGIIQDVVQQYLDGKLKKIESPTGPGFLSRQ